MKLKHLSEVASNFAKKYQDKTAYCHRNDETGQWLPTSFREFSEKVKKAAQALAAIGIKEQDRVGIFSQNMPEIIVSNFAIYCNRAIDIPLYATSSIAQVNYIVNHAEITTLFVGEQQQYDTAWEVLQEGNQLKRLIIYDRSVIFNDDDQTSVYFDEFLKLSEDKLFSDIVEKRMESASIDDIASILYTSGTTGEPKGVMLHHSNFAEIFRIHDIRLTNLTDNDRSMCFLPLTHIFEKTWSYYMMYKGIPSYINLRPVDIQKTIKEVRPTLMCSVPRFWEKVYTGVQEKINTSTGIARKLLIHAVEIGKKRNIEYARLDKKVPFLLEMRYKFYERTLFKKVKTVIGIENGNFFPTSGAPLSDEINEFLHAIGINICYGYGMTETTATVSCFTESGYTFGSVGKLMPEIEVRIGADNEIQLRGKTMMKGYYKRPEETAATFTEDGFLRTGDAGKVEGDTLYMTERIKDLFKTANGKYIAPQALETKLCDDKYIEMVAIVADRRKFVSAIIVPAYDMLKQYATEKGITYSTMEELVNNPDVLALYKSHIYEKLKAFAPYEQVKRFTLLAKPFSMESGELTNTLKVKRRVVYERHADEIEAMYKD
ncbi:MAG: AMP-dependent synthetase/ligase [Bacteroidales bacterium]